MPHVVRRVAVAEYPAYRTHLLALDADSRYLRFGFAINDYTLNKLCDDWEADSSHHILFCIEDSNLDFVAIGHVAVTDTMELAFSVLKTAQGLGMGAALMRRCIQYCRTHNILHGYMVCLPRNSVIKHLCDKYGIGYHTDHGETTAKINLPAPSVVTFISEATDSNLAIMDYLCKRVVHNRVF